MARKAGDLGLFGAWLNPRYPDGQRIEFAAELDDLGFRYPGITPDGASGRTGIAWPVLRMAG